jgi:predicted dehydrogenase
MLRFLVLIFLSIVLQTFSYAQTTGKMRIAVAGITHGHSGWIMNRLTDSRFEVVGIQEADTAIARAYAQRYKIAPSLFHVDLAKMLDELKPTAVVAFGTIHDHLNVVEVCAPRKIHVMVEKPLAVSLSHATKMKALALKHGIHLLTNYETSWYPSTQKACEWILNSDRIGTIRKAVFHHGHEGPKEIGVSPEFFNWLTHPVLNGGGAVTDFGCYGANIMTLLMKGATPVSITASLKSNKPDIYPQVDDEATIIVDFSDAQCIIQASWNWPFSRKDLEVYGTKGYIFAPEGRKLIHRLAPAASDTILNLQSEKPVDPFYYFIDVINGKQKQRPYDLFSLENNFRVSQIIEAAKLSAMTKGTIAWSEVAEP